MKKKLNAILGLVLATTLFTSAAPATLSMHYCGGELMDASFYEHFESCCDIEVSNSDHPTMAATSCEFEQYTFNSYEDGVSSSPLIAPVCIEVSPVVPFHFVEYIFSDVANQTHYRGPPSPSGIELCIRLERYLL